MVLGRYPDLSLKTAREERDRLAGQVVRGVSPAEERQKERFEQKERAEGRGSDPTLTEFAERWYRELVLPPKGRNHRRDPKPVRGALDNQILPALGGKGAEAITKADLRKYLFEKRNAGYETAALFQRQIHQIDPRLCSRGGAWSSTPSRSFRKILSQHSQPRARSQRCGSKAFFGDDRTIIT
jgi:hypothetical protein